MIYNNNYFQYDMIKIKFLYMNVFISLLFIPNFFFNLLFIKINI